MKKIKKIISKSAVLYQQNKPLRILNIELPEYLERGQVLVKVHYSGICGSQIGEIDGVKGPDRFLPHLLGHEGVCSILEVGSGVKNIKKGDRAIIHPTIQEKHHMLVLSHPEKQPYLFHLL